MRELQFDDMHLFTRVAELGTLSAVARERNVPVSQVSRTLTRIEKACGARLVHRSTHGLSLSAEGETFRDYCRRVTGAMEELEGEFASSTGEPRGTVRVAASSVIAQYELVPSLPALAAKWPGLHIELVVGDRMADMAREGIDIAIRTMPEVPENVVARRIGTLGRALYAAPAYVAARGLPSHPDDLAAHELVTNSVVPALNRWPFTVRGRPLVHTAAGRWRTNDTNIAVSMVLQGLGIGRLASNVGDALVREKRLVAVLPEHVDRGPIPIHAITLGTARHRLPKIRACLDHWSAWFGGGHGAKAAA